MKVLPDATGQRMKNRVTVHAGRGLAQFFGGKLAYFALRTNAENWCPTLSNFRTWKERQYP